MPARIVVIYAHPYPSRSRAGKALLHAISDVEGLEVRSLYSRYPDFGIDIDAEQEALLGADLIVWQSPFYWYGVPALLHHWFEKVLALGWAYGDRHILRGKHVLFAVTTGGPPSSYSPEGMHGHPFETFLPPVSQTAKFCAMEFCEPFILHGAHRLSEEELAEKAREYRATIERAVRNIRNGNGIVVQSGVANG